jgi:pseudouridine-5'-monophosphatase
VKLRCAVTSVIFDLDGVLLDTEDIYTRVIGGMLKRFGHTYDWSVKARVMGAGLEDAARLLIEVYRLPLRPSEYIAEFETRLADALPDAEPLAFVVPFTRALSALGVPMAIATSTVGRVMPAKTRRHREWLSIFPVVICGDHPDIHASKPAPDPFLVAARALGADPSACVVFEDSPVGVAAARAAGMQVVAIPHPSLDVALVRDADAVIGSFSELAPADLGF